MAVTPTASWMAMILPLFDNDSAGIKSKFETYCPTKGKLYLDKKKYLKI